MYNSLHKQQIMSMRTYCPPKKSHAKNAKSAKKWKAVGEPGCVSPRNNNKMSAVTLCPKRAYPNDEAENAPWMAPVSGAFADTRKISFAAKAPSSRWIAAVSAAVYFLAAKDAENTK